MAVLDRPPPPAPPERAPPPAEKLGLFTRLRIAFGRAWEIVRDVGAVLHPPRFSVFMVLAGGALLLANEQGRDLAVGLVGGDFIPTGLAFHACVLLWAFQSWYWSRLMLDVTYGLNREKDSAGVRYPPYAAWLLRHTPHVIALAAYIVAGIALLLAGAWWHLAALAAVGAGFYWLLARRLAFTDRLHKMFGPAARRLLGDPDQPVWRLRDLPPFSKMVLWGSFVLAAVSTALVLADPVAFGWTLGAAAVPFLGFAMIVPVGSLLVYSSRLGGAAAGSLGFKSYPVLTTLVIWALIVGAFIDNHAVRLTPPLPAGSPGPGARVPLDAATERWHAAAAKAAGTQAPPLVIVATAGGGLRAAYWTATVLGRLQDEVPGFRAYLFGVSGVSGGSLGAAVFATLLADGAPAPGPSCGTRKAFECAGQAMLAHDFLGPTAASLLFPDLMQRFIPAPIFPEDRAAALERAWERAWGKAGLPPDAWTRRSFSALWRSDEHLPALFLNGTHVESGKRIITSNLKIDGAAFRDAYDFFALVSGDVLPSTAADNSARFPYVGPAGTLRSGGENRGHIVDGGYFENFGALTAQEALNAVLAELARKGRSVYPVLIQISNDPKIQDDDLDVDLAGGPAPRPPNRVANEFFSPPLALLHTRDARGILAYKDFMRAAPPERRAHFRLCDVKGLPAPALGWVLAKPSLELMQRVARDDTCDNRAAFERIVKALRP